MHPTVTQMMPQTRHYVDRRLIFDNFEDMFEDYDDFTKIYDVNCWKSIGAEFFSKKWFVPGALFSAHPYQLKLSRVNFSLIEHLHNGNISKIPIFFKFTT